MSPTQQTKIQKQPSQLKNTIHKLTPIQPQKIQHSTQGEAHNSQPQPKCTDPTADTICLITIAEKHQRASASTKPAQNRSIHSACKQLEHNQKKGSHTCTHQNKKFARGPIEATQNKIETNKKATP